MSRIHPAENRCNDTSRDGRERKDKHRQSTKFTVWKRSSMSFQGTDGFTVFDEGGRLAFRVDNYSRKHGCCSGGGLLLMDGAGNGLLTLKPQVLTMQCQWNAYKGDDGRGKGQKYRVFSMRRGPASSFLSYSGKDEAVVFMGHPKKPGYRIEGSFRSRNCIIRSDSGEEVAKITRKRVKPTVLLGDDVFSLVAKPGFDCDLIMAFVIIMDRICSKPLVPLLCS